MHRRSLLLGGASLLLAGCVRQWETNYEKRISPEVSRAWRLSDVDVRVPDSLTVSNANTYAPNADIVWRGEPFGNRRAQVDAIMTEGITRAGRRMKGAKPVILSATVRQFHAVTPIAVSRAPTAVHNISYAIRVFDARSSEPLTDTVTIQADFEAFTGVAAVAAVVEGRTQRVRIVNHIDAVTAGWLGVGPERRRRFTSIGR